MLFVEFRFFIFFAIVFSIYWSLRRNDHRKWVLLVASYIFYGCWDWRFAFMLLGLSMADYFFSRRIHASESPPVRRAYVIASLAMNLGVLGFFKYFNFFTASAIQFAGFLGLHLSEFTLAVVLPIGISFFTFQSLSYTIDVYRKEIPPAPSLHDYLVFSSFFPQLVAGPIVRPKYFLPQLEGVRRLQDCDIKPLLLLFLLGYFKKSCVADNISPYVDLVFAGPGNFSSLSVATGIWLYATQIYCDFSGYSDMAIAVAGLLGYRLVLNFDAPYLAVSIQDFWRRWHISLSSWIRDYIYISLGGRSKKVYVTYRNLLITMLAGGLWHGASWNFVFWGGLHGAALVCNHEFQRIVGKNGLGFKMPRFVGWILTINFVCFAWIFFRAPNFGVSLQIIKKCLLINPAGLDHLPVWISGLPIGLLAIQFVIRRLDFIPRFCAGNNWVFSAVYGGAWACVIAMLPLGYRPFIYFQF